MSEGFRERAERVNDLLGDRRTTFVLVTSPRRDAVDEAIFFHRRLRERGMPFGGVVVNRMNTLAVEGEDPDERELAELLGDELGLKVAGNLDEYEALAARDRRT